ncbi:hypothetical protein ARMGADRAFT_1085121 [Armillaria gallica]|uniref:Uncharacterized protein n=1 Tax=Armillaria gallica TaxID=47427 RepID=A0A2H3DAC1_ARMGA|nr:hypothetical protein ARMGADRAFT_1085121 [Armillaria gallica]
MLTEKTSDPNKPRHGKSEEEMLSLEQAGLAPPPATELPWTSTLPLNEEILLRADTLTPRSLLRCIPTATDPYLGLPQGTGYATYVPGLMMNNEPWRMPSAFSPTNWRSGFKWRGQGRTVFDHFVQDNETFGGFNYDLLLMTEDIPKFYLGNSFPLPDSPPYRRYFGKGTSRLVVGTGDDAMAEGLGTGPAPTMEEGLQQAHDQIVQMHTQQNQLMEELEKLRGKGKEPDRERPPLPNGRQPPYQNPDRFSVPQPPRYDPIN